MRTRLAVLASGLLVGGLAVGIPPTQAAPAADKADAAAAAEFTQVELAKGEAEMGEPMTLDVLPDSSVLHTSRDGTVRLTDADGNTSVAGKIPVYNNDEEGLQGVGVDPAFDENRFVYFYYAPPLDTPGGGAPETGSPEDFEPFDGANRLSRFVLGEDGTLDLDSETEILDVAANRGICCHVGGDIAFDSEGNLLLSTGDDSNPFVSDGYTPIDERADRNTAFDAQRSAGNTNDLRGKVLRIKVGADGSYTIPEGNLFPEGTEKTRPEIYAMGFRNPFRMSVDQATDTVYLGDYGPDAGAADPARGPGGQVEFNRITEAGNFGWPYCTGNNDAYTDYDFGSETSGEQFDCSAPVNNSPNNTGLEELPPAQAAWIPYDGDSVPEFGGGSESPMGGPVYNYDADLDSDIKFPEEYDGNYFAGEFGRQWIKRIEVDGSGSAGTINEFPWTGTQVMDMEFGPDGALYVLDYGTGYFGGDENSAVYRIEASQAAGDGTTAAAKADTTSGAAPLEVKFSAEGSTAPEGEEISYSWDFGDGETSDEANPTHTYTENGSYTATLEVTSDSGTDSAEVKIEVGTALTVELVTPTDGQPFAFGDDVPFEVKVTDPEGGEVDCENVEVNYILGHDMHGHPLSSAKGCEGTLDTPADGGHDPAANLFGVFDAKYTSGDVTANDQHTLQPTHRQAEHFTESAEGVTTAKVDGAEGTNAITEIEEGQWIAFEPYDASSVTELSARVQASGEGAIEVRAGAADGELVGTVDVAAGDDWQDLSTAVADVPADAEGLYLVFTGSGYSLDSFHVTLG